MSDNGKGLLPAFLLGGLAGSIFTFLYTPCSGRELRQNIKNEIDNFVKKAQKKEEELITKAKATADELVLTAEQIAALAQKYSDGVYEVPLEKFENEIKSLRAAFDAALNEYKKSKKEAAPTEEIVSNIFSEYEDEKLPKHEGMRKRR